VEREWDTLRNTIHHFILHSGLTKERVFMTRKEKAKTKAIFANQHDPKPKTFATVTAANAGQKNLLRAIANPDNSVIMTAGIAGTGKTHVAVAWGVEQFMRGKYEKLVLTRPTVESGEKLGFLPKERSKTKLHHI